MKSSIVSFPDRGPWGQNHWRGNSSGYLLKELLESPVGQGVKVFVDPMMGSGTFVEVARELGREAYGLDLHQGFNILSHSILERVGKPADLCLSHPPYAGMIVYSGEVWGQEPVAGDLSRMSVEEFNEALQIALMNQREAVKAGGIYGCLIGDWRRGGEYHSLQAEAIARMPKELISVVIKAQHNTRSYAKSYPMSLPRIAHEYLLLWRKKEASFYALTRDLVKREMGRLQGTWKAVVQTALMQLGGQATLERLYAYMENNLQPELMTNNSHWRDKIRQVLNQNPKVFSPLARGHWQLA